MKRHHCYCTNDLGDEYLADDREQADGYWVSYEEAQAQIATLNAKLARVREIAAGLEYRAINAKLQGQLRENYAHFIMKEIDEILREVGR